MLTKLAKKALPQGFKNEISDRLISKSADRQQIVVSHVSSDDSVLDVGCVQHSLERVDWPQPPKGQWLHADLCRTTDDVFGIDIVEEEIERMSEAGYDVIVDNAETFDLDSEFDVIVAGELIEHLSNPGLFLERCREHIRDNGRVILTTPNPRRLEMLLWYLRGRESNANSEHTMWFDHYVLETLANRHNFSIQTVEYHRPALKISSRTLYQLGLATSFVAGGWVFVLQPTST